MQDLLAQIALLNSETSDRQVDPDADALRLTISPQGMLREFRCKASGKDYAAGSVPFPILHLVRRGVSTPVCRLRTTFQLKTPQFGVRYNVSGRVN